MTQSQLATFDLQISTIKTLTPAILDYVTAEKGATASASDFKSMTNGLAQALNGNFASLTRTGFVLDEVTKNTIKNGTETERAAALVKVLNSTYKDFNASLRNTDSGKMQVLANTAQEVQTIIGTGIITSTNNGQTLEGDLANSTTYRAYVRVASLINGDNYFSAWAFSQFALAIDSPATPTVSAFFDLVIGAVLVHGAKAPKLVSNEMVSRMKHGSVLVDIAIDQGGCFEDSKPTTHAEPTFEVHNSIFYCVANMPGAVPVTSTYALTNATLTYALSLAAHGWEKAIASDKALAAGLNVHDGKIMYEAVAVAHGY
jgi:hypothetical protein